MVTLNEFLKEKQGMDYRQAGVDVKLGRSFVDGIRQMVESTFRPEVMGRLGGFSGCFGLPTGYQEPVLVSGTDGVGTKLKLAFAMDCHHTVGIDLVAMCVNDVLTSGAEPLFFLDYLATGKLTPAQLTQVVSGIAQGCRLAGCALLGGETAEMPGFYHSNEYDMAGFCVGMVERSQMLDGSRILVDDVAIALASSGVHSNGFSLVRKVLEDCIFPEQSVPLSVILNEHHPDSLGGASLGEVLLTPTQIYVQPVLAALGRGLEIHGMAHITGGGLPENLPRCLGVHQSIVIDPSRWSVPPIFQWIENTGKISKVEMYHTFNMGVGFVIIVPANQQLQAVKWFQNHGILAFEIGKVIAGCGELVGLPS